MNTFKLYLELLNMAQRVMSLSKSSMILDCLVFVSNETICSLKAHTQYILF